MSVHTAKLLAHPAQTWRQIILTNVGRICRKPRTPDQRITLKHYPGELRQITITDFCHEKPTLLITNQMDVPASVLVDRYARRIDVENTIADAIDFFHMDSLSAAVPLKVQLDLQLTFMASALYRVLTKRLGNGMENARARTVFRKVVNASATNEIKSEQVVVSIGRLKQPAADRRWICRATATYPLAWKSSATDPVLLKAGTTHDL